jgi:hypothetical protein
MASLAFADVAPQDPALFRSARPTVGGGEASVPFNTSQSHPFEPTADSATVDVYSGIMDHAKLTKLRERAIYDVGSLSYAPLSSSGRGVLFPGAVEAKAAAESALRTRPTTFRGRQQLDVGDESGDAFINRQLHPNGTNVSTQAWYVDKDDVPFRGFPNPDLHYLYTDAIPSHNVQNLGHAQMTELLRRTGGNYDHSDYLKSVGALMRSTALDAPAHASIEHVVQSDGGGVDGDPRLLERMNEEYECGFQKARRLRVADAANDPRFGESAPSVAYTAEKHAFEEAMETQFSRVAQFTGMASSYTNPERRYV